MSYDIWIATTDVDGNNLEVTEPPRSDRGRGRAVSPQRIQRRRTKGWRKPEGAVYVGRGSRWGNPWVPGKVLILTGKKAGQWIDQKDAVRLFRNTLNLTLSKKPKVRAQLEELRGKDLMCWCPLDQPCHADVLLKLANADDVPTTALADPEGPALVQGIIDRKQGLLSP